jgi:hypothetical protein
LTVEELPDLVRWVQGVVVGVEVGVREEWEVQVMLGVAVGMKVS